MNCISAARICLEGSRTLTPFPLSLFARGIEKGEGLWKSALLLMPVFLLATSASAQITKVKGGYRFLSKYTPGHVTRYQTTTTAGNVDSTAKGITIKIPLT